jgi:tripartite-type tricarboxylate transporter receptor subunit TctC
MPFYRTAAAVLLAGCFAAPAVAAETYPSHTVHLIVPYAAGGTGDIVARIVADRLSVSLGQSVVVENRPGATGAIGTQSVATSAPDGHTLLVGQTGEIAINPHWSKGLGYDPDKDLVPIALATVVPLALVVPGKAPYATVGEMVKASHEHGLTFASAGTATPGHLAGEVLKFKTGSNMTHVPYKGATPALNDLLGAHVDLFFSGFPAAMPHVKAGTLRLLAVSTGKRSGVAPEVPTVAEAVGLPGFDIALWQGFFAPRGTPKEIVDRLNAEINKILAEPDVREKLLEQGADVTPMQVAAFAAFVKAEIAKFQGIIRDAGLKPE